MFVIILKTGIFSYWAFLPAFPAPTFPCSHSIITDGILPVKTNRIIFQWLHLIFMCRTATWNNSPSSLSLFFFIFSNIWHKWVWSLHPQLWFDPPPFSLSLFLLSTVIHLRHVVLQVHIPYPVISVYLHFSCSKCQLDSFSPWSHPVVLTNHTIECSPSNALNLVSFVLNFQLACTVCLLLILYNARALRWNSEQGKLHNPALKEHLQAHLQSTWPMIVPVSGMTTVQPPTPISAMFMLFLSS